MTTTRPATRPRHRFAGFVTGVAAIGAITAGCSGSIVHSYRTFQSAVDRGASCSELFDQRARLSGGEQAKADGDLARIGCTSPQATRTDR